MSALSDSHAGICPAGFAARPTHIAKLLGVIFPAVAAGFGFGAAPAYADSADLGECLASADCTRVPADFAQHVLRQRKSRPIAVRAAMLTFLT